jgi:hypothetical protein
MLSLRTGEASRGGGGRQLRQFHQLGEAPAAILIDAEGDSR